MSLLTNLPESREKNLDHLSCVLCYMLVSGYPFLCAAVDRFFCHAATLTDLSKITFTIALIWSCVAWVFLGVVETIFGQLFFYSFNIRIVF